MFHSIIHLNKIELSFPHKTCFSNFSASIPFGSRIAIIGANGTGKSTLLKMIAGVTPYEDFLALPTNAICGYVPQVISGTDALSGGGRFNAALSTALSKNPNILLLDEPTNHLDARNRKSLLRMLQSYTGTLIVVSHDLEVLRTCFKTFWAIDQGSIEKFSGVYDEYARQAYAKKNAIEQELSFLAKERRDLHEKRMREQERTAKSRAKGRSNVLNKKWMKSIGDLKGMKAEKAQGKKLSSIDHEKGDLLDRLSELRSPEIIKPKFAIASREGRERVVLQIAHGAVGYGFHEPVLRDINLLVLGNQKVAITGNNGSGKTTLVKAILGFDEIYRTGEWFVPKNEEIGYLDQHYESFDPDQSVFDVIASVAPHWNTVEIRSFLNDFLFRKNEEVSMQVKNLSGGEKARLSLAKIGAKPPKLLILDEVTNNLDLVTREHVIQVLQAYPGALLVISHDEDFLSRVGVEFVYGLSI